MCVRVPCVAAPAPGQSAETVAAACGAELSALLTPLWQMTNPEIAGKHTDMRTQRGFQYVYNVHFIGKIR